MVAIERIFFMCNSDGSEQFSHTALNYRIVDNSSLISIIPDSKYTNVESISFTYQNKGQKISHTYNNFDLNSILNIHGGDLVTKILLFSNSLTDESINDILNWPTSVGDSDEQKIINTFLIGVANTLMLYFIANKLPAAFPVSFKLPAPPTGINDLTANYAEYVNHFASMIAVLRTESIAKNWCKINVAFWRYFSPIFNKGEYYKTHEAAQRSILDFADHVSTNFHDIENVTRNSIDTISSTSVKMSQEIETLSTNSLDSIQKLHDDCISDFDDVRGQIIAAKDEAIQNVEEVTAKYAHRLEQEYKILSKKLEVQTDNALEKIDAAHEDFTSHCDNIKSEMSTMTPTAPSVPSTQLDHETIKTMIKNEVNSTKPPVPQDTSNLDGFFSDVNDMKTNYVRMKSKVDRLETCLRDLTNIMSTMKVSNNKY